MMQTVVETPEFIRCAKRLDLSDDERESIIDLISSNPEVGNEISGTSGMRKVRIAGKGKGKSGGYRVITFFTGSDIPVFLITIYRKGQKANITAAEKKVMKILSNAIIEIYRSKEDE
ncbi:MAG: type II toxin-antitoxin system RelE/ParE family toxin [Deltaproteobacteria bacterium]|nr:type II toxin-antitoxin system RelE/ParE family toxin [Deltaproteobacteria bacterium]